jgi:hypothetical protein
VSAENPVADEEGNGIRLAGDQIPDNSPTIDHLRGSLLYHDFQSTSINCQHPLVKFFANYHSASHLDLHHGEHLSAQIRASGFSLTTAFISKDGP